MLISLRGFNRVLPPFPEETSQTMLQALFGTTGRLLKELKISWQRRRAPSVPSRPVPSPPPSYLPLQRVLLTDGVARTLFEQYATHRAEARGEEETGWFLLGLRERDQAIVLATLPAGTQRDASVTHVRFNSLGQVIGSVIVRQLDRRLAPLGVVHTHPGSLRHPSDGDYSGDSQWVRGRRRGEGIFGIGTADGSKNGTAFAQQPRPHLQCLGELCFSWYSLRAGESNYRPLEVAVTLGPDLARPLHQVWPMIEAHAEQLHRLYCQQARIMFDVVTGGERPGLAFEVPLAEPESAVRVVMKEKQVRYYLVRNGGLLAADCAEEQVDRGVYLLLAALAAQAS